MTTPSPIHHLHRDAEATFIRYADAADVVETFAHLELEYAAIRKSAAILDLPHHATVRARGGDRLEFLNRMLTQKVDTLSPWRTARAFLTTRQGRLIADLTLINTPDETLLDTDILAADPALEALQQLLFGEDVQLDNVTPTLHRLAIHGPTALPLLEHLATPDPTADGAPPLSKLQPAHATRVLIGAHPVLIHRHDSTASPGYLLTADAAHVETIYTAILDAGVQPDHDHVEHKTSGEAQHPYRLRPIGWHAYNIARIEAGTPLFDIDFAQGNLPAETGVLHDRVSFTKGCYPGQEVVARMHNLGHPKQILTALRVTPPDAQPPFTEASDAEAEVPPKPRVSETPAAPEHFVSAPESAPDYQPLTGAAVLEAGAPDESKPVGAVTSSTRSPMLSDAIICFAQLKWDVTDPGTTLDVLSPAGRATGEVRAQLRAWPPER